MKIVKESARVTLEDNQQLREKIDQLEKEIEITSKGDTSSGKYFYILHIWYLPLVRKIIKNKVWKIEKWSETQKPVLRSNKNRGFQVFLPEQNTVWLRFYEHFRIFAHSTGWPISLWTNFKSGCDIQMNQATPTKFSMLFKHNYSKNFWKFGGHSFNYFFVHGLSVPGYWRP